MKINIISKPNCKRGASIVIAMLIFLLCALAGASAFFMAASNMGRYSHKNDQNYYSVSSAALMIVDMLDGLTYESKAVEFVYERAWEYVEGDEHTISDGYTLNIPAEVKDRGAFTAEHATTLKNSNLYLCGAILSRCNELVPFFVPGEWYDSAKNTDLPQHSGSLSPASYKFTVTVPDDDKFGTVNCTLVMTTNYDLTITFAVKNSDGKAEASDTDSGGEYAITVYWQADVKQNKEAGTPQYNYTDPTTMESGGYNYKYGSQKQTDKLQITAAWNKKNVTISRGETISNEISEP